MKNLTIVLVAAIAAVAMLFSSCGKKAITWEEFKNDEVKELNLKEGPMGTYYTTNVLMDTIGDEEMCATDMLGLMKVKNDYPGRDMETRGTINYYYSVATLDGEVITPQQDFSLMSKEIPAKSKFLDAYLSTMAKGQKSTIYMPGELAEKYGFVKDGAPNVVVMTLGIKSIDWAVDVISEMSGRPTKTGVIKKGMSSSEIESKFNTIAWQNNSFYAMPEFYTDRFASNAPLDATVCILYDSSMPIVYGVVFDKNKIATDITYVINMNLERFAEAIAGN